MFIVLANVSVVNCRVYHILLMLMINAGQTSNTHNKKRESQPERGLFS